ncbi:HAD-IB family hydrolase [Kordiimonas sp.]|uniref:HAD-IB family hydrolase n=1 Tax=Kordiimonas sp. TaxID=1970157 RepID=UPI003A927AA2
MHNGLILARESAAPFTAPAWPQAESRTEPDSTPLPDSPGAAATCCAIVLAGRRAEADTMQQLRNGHGKAMAMMLGKPMLAHVIEALAKSGMVQEIVISAQVDLTTDPRLVAAAGGIALRHAPAQDSVCASVRKAYAMAGGQALVTTADNPLLQAETVQNFLRGATAHEGLAVGLVAKSVIRAKYPASKRTYYRFQDTAVSGANLFYLRGPKAPMVLDFWRQVEAHRKRPWRVLRSFGWGTVLGMALGQFRLQEGFERASHVIGCPVRPQLLEEPEAAMDVDSPKDFIAAEAILRDRQQERDEITPDRAASGAQGVAVFDLDRTLTRRGTFTPFLQSTRSGVVSRSVLMLRLLRHMVLYKARRISRLELKNRMLAATFRGRTPADIEGFAQRFARRVLDTGLRDGCTLALAMHKMEGDTMVLATASVDLYARHIAAGLGFDDVICTKTVFSEKEVMPVRIDGDNCYGASKLLRLRDRLLAGGTLDRGQVFVSFYSDHHADMPLLEWADTPVVVSPGIRTHAMAVNRQMAIVEW